VTHQDGGLRITWREEFALDPGRDHEPELDTDQALTFWMRREPTYVLVTVAGQVDIATAPDLHERLSALVADGTTVVADLDQVSFIDAAGLGVLARVARQAAARGTSLHVVCGRHRTRRLFRLTAMDRTVPLSGSLAEALQAREVPAPASGPP
jgi:anti-sigma B factor antagonist